MRKLWVRMIAAHRFVDRSGLAVLRPFQLNDFSRSQPEQPRTELNATRPARRMLTFSQLERIFGASQEGVKGARRV